MNSSRPSYQYDDLKKLADFLDTKIKLPGGFKIGWDGIIGFIPGIGDFITNLMSIYIILRATVLGCSPAVILHMGLNVLLDNLFDLIPVLGNFFDLFWKSNTKNLALIDRYVQNPTKTARASTWKVALAVFVVISVLLASVAAIAMVAMWAWGKLTSL